MLIDPFADDCLTVLDARAREVTSPNSLYLLLDGAFVEGLHRMLSDETKVCLFGLLPGVNEQTLDASPFLTPYSPSTHSLLKRCNRWPMVSAIETPEPIARLAERLAAWCMVDVERQHFNFRFADTRRLPAIYEALTPSQRGCFAGPSIRWSFVGRDGQWSELPLTAADTGAGGEAVLDADQFAKLVDDSDVDAMLELLRDIGCAVYRHPSRSHALVSQAQRAAQLRSWDAIPLVSWCAWYWTNDRLLDTESTISAMDVWRANTEAA